MGCYLTFRHALAGLWLFAGLGLVLAPRSCSLPVAATASQPGKPRPWSGFRPAQSAYLPARLPRPVKVPRDSTGRVITFKKAPAALK